jgi:hypothetical protein
MEKMAGTKEILFLNIKKKKLYLSTLFSLKHSENFR